MAAPATLSQLLDSLRQSVVSVSEATPKLSALTPPEDGLSLLDVKNELLLSYLEHMVFLILLKLRNVAPESNASEAEFSLEHSDLGQSVVKKLVELRLYLEKGVRPLEEKLRYQVEKALRAAEEAERAEKAKETAAAAEDEDEEDESGSGSDDDSDDGSEDEEDEEDTGAFDDEEASASRPNRSAFVRPSATTAAAAARSKSGSKDKEETGGVYRPPRIAPTMMPTTERRERAERRPLKSATMDEFVADELSAAPRAELSIGTNIAGRGRHVTTASERQRADERREYEERNFVRLPKESKKDRAKRGGDAGGNRMSFGGEEWHGLGEGVDRINRLTQRKSNGGGGGAGGTVRGMLDKSRKRGIDTVDGPRASGGGAGEDAVVGGRFQKRLRTAQKQARRERGKK